MPERIIFKHSQHAGDAECQPGFFQVGAMEESIIFLFLHIDALSEFASLAAENFFTFVP